VLVATLLSSPPVFAQMAVDFDPAASKIDWILVGNVHTVHGTFRLKQGHVDFDPINRKISGDFIVLADSGDSGSGARDKRMKKEILETDKFPEIRLKLTKLQGAVALDNASDVRVSGEMTIHGARHEVSVPLQVTVSGTTFTGKGKFILPYVDWGMKDPSNFLFKVNKTVEIDIEAQGQIKR
jgi:polyisoprenoid-binding protein YceI